MFLGQPGIIYNCYSFQRRQFPMGASFGPGIYSLAIKYLSLFCILYLVLANASAICWQVGCIFFSWRLKQELQVGGLDIRPLALYVVPWLCSRALPHSSLPGARVRTPFCKGTRGMRHPIVPICPATKSHGWWWSRIDQPVLREPLTATGDEYPRNIPIPGKGQNCWQCSG